MRKWHTFPSFTQLDRKLEAARRQRQLRRQEAHTPPPQRKQMTDFIALLKERPDCLMEAIMERVCFLLKARPDKLVEYKKRHSAVWPDVLQALRETGWHNYSLFLRDDGLLV